MSIRMTRLASSFCILAIVLAMSWASCASAATITVISTADSGAGSLRDAVASANSGDTIVFGVTGTVTLTSGPIAIDQNLEISGPGTISGGGTTQVFIVGNGFSVTVGDVTIQDGPSSPNVNGAAILNSGTLIVSNSVLTSNAHGAIDNAGTLAVTNSTMENGCGNFFTTSGGGIFNSGTLTVTGGTFTENNTGLCEGGAIFNTGNATITGASFSANTALSEGGAIINDGSLTISDSTFSGNSATSTVGGSGGAIANEAGTLTVDGSTFSGNSVFGEFTSNGGAVSNGGTLIVTNSTFSGNSSLNGPGGAISNTGGLTVTNSTFSDNNSNPDGDNSPPAPGPGGAISTNGPAAITESTFSGNMNGAFIGPVSLKGVILAGGTASSPNCPEAITDAGYNISDDASCAFTATGSLNSADPQLDPNGLQNNGGPTETIALLSTSPAVDAIPLSACTDQSSPPNPITTDQRGFPRPDPEDIIDPSCDIGAYELQGPVFSSFTANLTISGGRRLGFTLVSDFTASTTITSVDPLTEPVSLLVGSYSATIAPGSVRQLKNGTFAFDWALGGMTVHVRIVSLSSTSFQFEAIGEPVNLLGLSNPVTVAVAVGGESGTASVTARFIK